MANHDLPPNAAPGILRAAEITQAIDATRARAVQAAYKVASLLEDYPWGPAGAVPLHWAHLDALDDALRVLVPLADRLDASQRRGADEDVRLQDPPGEFWDARHPS